MKLNNTYFLNPAHLEIAKARYFLKNKDGKIVENDIDEVFVRETNYVFQNDTEENKQKALKYRREKKIVPAGRMLAQAGTDVRNLYNCFLIGFDDDTREAISELKRKHFHIQASGGGCIDGNTPIYTKELGIINIKDIPEFRNVEKINEPVKIKGYTTFSFNNITNIFQEDEITHIWKFKVLSEDVRNINFTSGHIKTSAWHPFFVRKDGTIILKRSDELQKGDKVLSINTKNHDANICLDNLLLGEEIVDEVLIGNDDEIFYDFTVENNNNYIAFNGNAFVVIHNTGMNFSTLRPRGSICKTNQSRSSGAVGFIGDLSYQSSNVQQPGNRSGANLGLLEDWHPDLLEFITKKSSSNWENIRKFAIVTNENEFQSFQWNNHYQWQMFNVSVLLSDDFMSRVINSDTSPWVLKWKDKEWHLWEYDHNGKKIIITAPYQDLAFYKASSTLPYFNSQNMKLVKGPYDISAVEWFDMICKNAWEDGCPGIMFIDVARRFHNGEYFNPICGANPCGEILLPKNSVCCLNSICLPSFFKHGKFDWDDYKEAIRIAVRGLDNVLDISKTGEKDIDESSRRERRIGLGTTGIAELLILEKKKYSSKEGRDYVARILEVLRDTAYETSIELARERGPFPAFDFEGFSKSAFFKTLPLHIQEDIKKYGIRNVNLTTQQPAGTTGTMLGFSQGCEPYFSMNYIRNSRVGSFIDGSPSFIKWLHKNKIDYSKYNFSLKELKKDFGVPEYFEESHEISWNDHIKMQAVFAKYLDQGISKTINLPNEATIDDVRNAYIEAYKLGIKSTTVYRDGSKQQILETGKKKESKRPDCIVPASSPKRPDELECDIHTISVKGDKWVVLVGLLCEQPYEIFATKQDAFELSTKYKKGKIVKGGKGQYHLDTGDFIIKNISKYLKSDEHRIITRLTSLSLRSGVPMEFIIDQLEKVEGTVVDFSKAILRVLNKYSNNEIESEKKKGKICSNCGSTKIIVSGGCFECLNCNYSKCS